MPIYELKNKETGEIFELNMKIAEYEQYMKENSHIERHFSNANMTIDEVVLGRKKPPSDFTEGVINRIKANNPRHNMSSRWD